MKTAECVTHVMLSSRGCHRQTIKSILCEYSRKFLCGFFAVLRESSQTAAADNDGGEQ